MTRMRAEADHLGADGIVGGQLKMQMYVWGQEILEFVATGTAVRGPGWPGRAHRAPDGRAFTSDLVRAGLLPAAGHGAVPVCVRAGHVRVPHRAPGGHAVAAPDRPEHRDAPVHAGHLRGARAGPGPDAVGGPRRPRASGIVGVSVGVFNHVWGRARDGVPGHRDGHPAAVRRATGCPRRHPSPRSPWAWTTSCRLAARAGVAGRGRNGAGRPATSGGGRRSRSCHRLRPGRRAGLPASSGRRCRSWSRTAAAAMTSSPAHPMTALSKPLLNSVPE